LSIPHSSPATGPSKAKAAALHEAVAAELRAAHAVANVPVASWIEDVPITRDSIYRVLRGQRPVSVVELVLLCRAIEEDPLELIARAVNRATAEGQGPA